MTTQAPNARRRVDLSIIAPAQNEEENISVLVGEVSTALGPSGFSFELIIVDDGSTDQTAIRMAEEAGIFPWLHPLRLARRPNGASVGKTAALHAGVRQATGRWIAFMDADLQNDPRDLPKMLEVLRASGAALIQGNRCARRRDNWVRRVSSRIAWDCKWAVIRDQTQDSGCGFTVMTRELALQLPLQFSGMHRFLPFYTRLLGLKPVETPVNHRFRLAGRAKYGIWNRALPGLIDLLAVLWMRHRIRTVEFKPMPELTVRAEKLREPQREPHNAGKL
jgi:dolichol-phosphate mannosyltransferase